MNVSFPEKKGTDKDLKFNNQFGKYLISNFNTWHGGIHIEGRNNPIQAIADGRIIAYRLAEDYELLPKTHNVTSRKGESTDYKYSNSFILVQHDLELSKEVTENKGQEYELKKQEKKNITFYSLYNHLMPLNEIQNNNLKYPDFFATEAIKVTSNEGYEGLKKTKINGLNARTLTNGKIFPLNKGAIKFVIPEGEIATIYKNALGEIPEEIDGYARVIYNGHNDIYVNTKTKFVTKIGDTYKIIYKHDSELVDNENSLSEEEKNKKGARVRKEPKSKTEIVDIIPNGEIVQIIEKKGANSKWYKIKGYEGGYSHSSNFKETNTFDESKITKNDITACDIPLKSGQNIGYTGLLSSRSSSYYYSACQLDVFMAEGVEDFLSNTFKAGANKKDFITVPQGATLKKSITVDVDLKKENNYKILQVNGTFAQITINRVKTQEAIKKSLLGTYVKDGKNSHYPISPQNFFSINRAFKHKLPIGTNKLYWVTRSKSDGTEISEKEENELISKNKAYIKYRKVEFRPKATDVKKTYWVNLDDLQLKIKVVTKKTKKRIPKSIEDYNSIYEWFTADDRFKEVEHEYQIPEIKNAGKGEITKLNKNIKSAYLVIPEKPEDCDEILEKEAVANIKNARTTPDGKWIEVTCTCPIGSEYLVQKGWIENNLTPFSPFNWNKFGFNTFEAGEEYIYDIKDVYDSKLTTSNFTKTLWGKIDSLKGKDHGLIDQKELKLAYRTLETQFYVAKMVCKHKTEWSYTPQEIINEVTTLYDYYISLEPEEAKADLEKLKEKKLDGLKGQVEKLMFWNELQGVAYTPENNTETQEEEIIVPERNLPSVSNLWHFHPIAFINQMKLIGGRLDMTTFFIHHNGKIEKHLAISNEKKYKYIYIDDKGAHHEICIAEYNITKKKKYGVVRYSKPTHSTEVYDNIVSDGNTTRRVKYTNNDIAEYGSHPTLGMIWRLYEAENEDVEIVKMPDDLNYSKDGTVIKYKFTSTKRRYTGPGSLAGFIGALAEHGIKLKTTGSCFKEGSCFPSKKHVNGESVDTLYTKDKIKDQKVFNAMKKFHFEERLIGNNTYFANFVNAEDGGDLHDSHLHSGEFNNNKIKIVK